jgi:hypothetical protein
MNVVVGLMRGRQEKRRGKASGLLSSLCQSAHCKETTAAATIRSNGRAQQVDVDGGFPYLVGDRL